MAQADTTPTSLHIRKPFEELALFWLYTGGAAWRGARLDGEFEVTVHPNGDWIITDVWIAVDNGKTGSEAAGKLINLDADTDERLYLTVLDALDHSYTSRIAEWIADELDARDLKVAA